jgi:putative heme iron utilization protein
MELFGPTVTDAVMRHMNDDHAADSLLICRALGAQPTATAARMSGMDQTGIHFEAQVDGGPVTVRIPWGAPVTERAQIRAEVVRMYTESRVALGLPATPEGGRR